MKLYWTSVVAATIAATSFAAYAGAKYNWPVFINKNADGSGNAGGTLGATRNSGDSGRTLGCYYDTYASGWKSAYCYANDTRQFATCGTTDSVLLDTISKLQGDAYLWFEFDSQGQCTGVEIGSQSFAPPKAP
jgi:hypothetical protein